MKVICNQSLCNMEYQINETQIDIINNINTTQNCLWINIETNNILRIDCIGGCLTSPTNAPIPDPTQEPTSPTKTPTSQPTNDPTQQPTL